MAITTMCSKETEGAFVEEHYGWDVSKMGPLYMHTHHVGVVLAVGEHNYYDDSDFFALVWDAEAGEAREVEYASTRGWTYPNRAGVDATPEVLAAYNAWQTARADAAAKARAEKEAQTVSRGKVVRVFKGRKVPIGTTGECFWIGRDTYTPRWAPPKYRIGIKDAAGNTHWTAADNCQVVM